MSATRLAAVLDVVLPRAAGERLVLDAELEDVPAERVDGGSATVAPSSAAYRNLPFGEIAIASMPRLLGCVAGCPTGRCGLFGDFSPPGIGERRIEEPALGVEVEDPRTELVADPQVAVVATLHRLGIDVGTRQQPLRGPLVDDREADHAVRDRGTG